jgi:enoyl-CoA hydratase
LSIENTARLLAQFGVARIKRMLMLAELISAQEALACGFVDVLAAPGEIDSKLAAMCRRLMSQAPLTIRAAKEAIRRIILQHLPQGDDLIRACYGSADFHEGVDAFLAKRRPGWRGR